MIRNDREFRIKKSRAGRLERLALELMNVSSKEHPRRREIERRAIESELSKLTEELLEYESLREGRVSVGQPKTLDDLPRILVRARIAKGLTQAQLAKRLGLKEQQVQRYEATEYESASLARLQDVAKVLGVRLDVVENESAASWRNVLRKLNSMGLDRSLVQKRLAPAYSSGGRQDMTAVLGLVGRVARVFGWEAHDVLSGNPVPASDPVAVAAFKIPRNRDAVRLRSYAAYAYYLSLQTLRATTHLNFTPIEELAAELHSLTEKDERITFEYLLNFTWQLGIPILPLSDPGGFHAAFWRHEGRGVIVLKQGHRNSALWSFDLGHELRHAIEAPHESHRFVVDLPPQDLEGHAPPEEVAANEFAADLLLGLKHERFFDLVWEKSEGKPALLKRTVELVARKEKVEVGLLAYYIAHRVQARGISWWGTAVNLQPPSADPWALCKEEFLARVDLSRLEVIDRELMLQALADNNGTSRKDARDRNDLAESDLHSFQ